MDLGQRSYQALIFKTSAMELFIMSIRLFSTKNGYLSLLCSADMFLMNRCYYNALFIRVNCVSAHFGCFLSSPNQGILMSGWLKVLQRGFFTSLCFNQKIVSTTRKWSSRIFDSVTQQCVLWLQSPQFRNFCFDLEMEKRKRKNLQLSGPPNDCVLLSIYPHSYDHVI